MSSSKSRSRSNTQRRRTAQQRAVRAARNAQATASNGNAPKAAHKSSRRKNQGVSWKSLRRIKFIVTILLAVPAVHILRVSLGDLGRSRSSALMLIAEIFFLGIAVIAAIGAYSTTRARVRSISFWRWLLRLSMAAAVVDVALVAFHPAGTGPPTMLEWWARVVSFLAICVAAGLQIAAVHAAPPETLPNPVEPRAEGPLPGAPLY